MIFVCRDCSPEIRHVVSAPTCRIVAYCRICHQKMHPLPSVTEGDGCRTNAYYRDHPEKRKPKGDL